MGWGDEVIASGQARVLQEAQGLDRKVIIRDRHGMIRKHEAWWNNPRIARRDEPVHKPLEVHNGPGMRPYIEAKFHHMWKWRDWECPVGEIYFDDAELKWAELFQPDIIVEPNLKAKASPNKNWGTDRWAQLIGLLREAGRRVVQLGEPGTRVLPGAKLIETPSLRLACAALARARVAVLPEGGLHHSAAALRVPAVVIFGGYISPRQTGYRTQKNFFVGNAGCGMRIGCRHCELAMASINPVHVAEAALAMTSQTAPA